jgi:hypothetical protein
VLEIHSSAWGSLAKERVPDCSGVWNFWVGVVAGSHPCVLVAVIQKNLASRGPEKEDDLNAAGKKKEKQT